MGNDAFDAPDASATTATPRGQEHEESSQSGQMMPWGGAESETNGVGSLGVLRATSGNATKRLKTRAMTKAEKSARAITMKQIATEERQAEKGKMKEWKENIMQEVARELHVIRQMHEGAMEAQRQSLQLELERMGGKVEQLESEVKALKVPGQLINDESSLQAAQLKWMKHTQNRLMLDNSCTRQELDEEVEWVETLLTHILNTHSKSMRVTLFSKRWWNKEVAKARKIWAREKKL